VKHATEFDADGYPLDPALRLCLFCDRQGHPAQWEPRPGDAALVEAPAPDAVLLLFLCPRCQIAPWCYARIRALLLKAPPELRARVWEDLT